MLIDGVFCIFADTSLTTFQAALLASMLATDLLFFDDGGDCGCECGEHG